LDLIQSFELNFSTSLAYISKRKSKISIKKNFFDFIVPIYKIKDLILNYSNLFNIKKEELEILVLFGINKFDKQEHILERIKQISNIEENFKKNPLKLDEILKKQKKSLNYEELDKNNKIDPLAFFGEEILEYIYNNDLNLAKNKIKSIIDDNLLSERNKVFEYFSLLKLLINVPIQDLINKFQMLSKELKKSNNQDKYPEDEYEFEPITRDRYMKYLFFNTNNDDESIKNINKIYDMIKLNHNFNIITEEKEENIDIFTVEDLPEIAKDKKIISFNTKKEEDKDIKLENAEIIRNDCDILIESYKNNNKNNNNLKNNIKYFISYLYYEFMLKKVPKYIALLILDDYYKIINN
jgi:hypothetical protein